MPDKFSSMKSLLSVVPAEGNYSFDISGKRNSKIKLFAPHGGCIEPGTRQIVMSLANNKWDYFIFRGIRKGGDCYETLHVKSENYDVESCVQMARNAVLAVAIHGRRVEESRIEVGGGSLSLAADLVRYLSELEYPAIPAPSHMSGQSETNFVNLAKLKGIQLELSEGFRKSLFDMYPNKPRPKSSFFPEFITNLRAWLMKTENRFGQGEGST
jgi:phage replication-related protein YjqB (UPF0714/DUF867 family)